MVDDRISRQALIDSAFECEPLNHGNGDWSTWHNLFVRIKYSPAVDAVPVVRCKECKYYAAPVVARDTGLCLWESRDELVAIDGYCSHGAKMEAHIETD